MKAYKFIFKGRPELLKVLNRRLNSLDHVIMDEGLGSEFRFLPAMFHTIVTDDEYALFKDEGLLYDCHELDGNELTVSAHGSMSSLFADQVNSSLGLGVFWTMMGAPGEFRSGVLLPDDEVQVAVLDRLGMTVVLTAEFEPVPRYSVDAVDQLKKGLCGLSVHIPSKRFYIYSFAGDSYVFQCEDLITGSAVTVHSDSVLNEMILLPHSVRLNDFICTTLYLGKLAEGEVPDFLEALAPWVEPALLRDAFKSLV